MDYEKLLSEWKKSGKTSREVSKKIYSSYPTKLFIGNEELEYAIKTKQPPAKAGGFALRTESPDTRRLNDAS